MKRFGIRRLTFVFLDYSASLGDELLLALLCQDACCFVHFPELVLAFEQ